MKSNLTKEDYKNLINESSLFHYSTRKIIINNINGEIQCHTIQIGNKYEGRTIDRLRINLMIRCIFKILLNNIPQDFFEKFIEGKTKIKIDNEEYYISQWTYNNEILNFEFVSYKLYKKNYFN